MAVCGRLLTTTTKNGYTNIVNKSCLVALSLVVVSPLVNEKDDDADTVKSCTTQCQSSTTQCDGTDLSAFAPTLPIYVFRPNPHLEIAFDVRTRNPVYVLEKLPVVMNTDDDDIIISKKQPSSSTSRRRRRPNFYEETTLPEMFRSRNGHYRQTGYDRGHMAPAADFMGGSSNSNNDSLVLDTFNLCNVSPQDPSLNRSLWAQLELWTRQVAQREWNQYGNETFVVTGPLWLPTRFHPPSNNNNNTLTAPQFEYSYPAIGQPPSLVQVPTHFFKVVVVVTKDDKGGAGGGTDNKQRLDKFACFVVPNRKLNDLSSSSSSSLSFSNNLLEDYLVRWSDLEAVVGIRFFPRLVQPVQRNMADALTDGVGEGGNRNKKHRLLLITDGSSPSSSSSLTPRCKNHRIKAKEFSTLEHLCSKGRCR